MLEAKKGQTVIIKSLKFPKFEGVIYAIKNDEIAVYYPNIYKKAADSLFEGEELDVLVHTYYGVKKMNSLLISNNIEKNMLIIENAQVEEMPQKREFARAAAEFTFFVKMDKKLPKAKCKDISASGMKFETAEHLEVGQNVTLRLMAEDFGKDLTIEAQVINNIGGYYVVKFENLNEYDKDRIVGFCNKSYSG